MNPRQKERTRWVSANTTCFSEYDDECQELEYFTQEPMDSEEFSNKLIKLRFTLPATGSSPASAASAARGGKGISSGSRGVQRVTECYNIDSLFRYVFQQIFENQPQIVTPTKKALSSSQIARIQRCYFGQDESELQWEDLEDFYSEMGLRAQEREREERQALLELYSQTDSDEEEDAVITTVRSRAGAPAQEIPDVIFEDNYDEGTRWLIEQLPVLEDDVPEFLNEMYVSMMFFLRDNGLLRLDRYTFNEIIENPENAQDIIQHLANEFADLEDLAESGVSNQNLDSEGEDGDDDDLMVMFGFRREPLPWSGNEVKRWLQSIWNFRWREELAPKLDEVANAVRDYLRRPYAELSAELGPDKVPDISIIRTLQSEGLPEYWTDTFTELQDNLENRFDYLRTERLSNSI